MEGGIPSDLEESVRELLGKRVDTSFRRIVRFEVKADKQEQRILVLTDYRLYILTAKTPAKDSSLGAATIMCMVVQLTASMHTKASSFGAATIMCVVAQPTAALRTKIEHNVHYLDITCLESKKPTQIVVVTSENRRLSLSLSDKDVEAAIKFMTSELRRSFPTTMLDKIMKVDVEPRERQRQLTAQPRESMLRDVGPCGGFSATYAAICDYAHQPFLDEVAWDVDTIYLSQDSKELSLADFDHLGNKHIVPIIGALQYNTWFTSLNANNVRLTTEGVNEVLRVMRKNTHLQELHVRNIGAKWEFAHKLAMALLHNSNSQLTVLDLSENPIEDRGLNHMCTPLRTLHRGLKQLNLARTGITAKGINRLAESLCANKGVVTSLTLLDLSDNALKGEEITNLYNFWAQPNVISTLRLSGTECALENLFGALLPGCCQHLTHLDLSRNVFSHRKTKDPAVPPAWKQFFATAEALQVINLSDTKLTAEALKNVLLGISSNLNLHDVELDVSSNHLRAAGADILQMTLPEMRNISTLNLSDNAFDNDMIGICNKLVQCESIKRLLIGRNFNNVKPKYMAQVMDSVVQMIQDEESTIESLSLADSRLKNDTTLIINALGSNSLLTAIDVSGNQMGDVGARMLAKALQINTKLHTIYWDRNGTTALGFSDIAQGLTKNHSVKKMPSPINDAAFALRLNAEKTEQALQKIEEVLKRNHSPRKLASDQGYRLHQGFLISSSQQMLDRLVVQVREHITTLEKGSRNLTEDAKTDIRNATRLVADANATKQVLPKLQQVALQMEHDGNLIDTKLSSVSQDLHAATQRQLKRTMSDMLKCMEEQCPTIMEDTEFTSSLQSTTAEKNTLPVEFTKTLLIDHVGADIMNKVSELNLAVAAHVSDRLIDGVLDSLDACHKKLTNHINSADSLTSPLSPLKEKQKPPRPEHLPSQEKGRPSANIDDDVFDEVAAQSTIKRKSLYSRRLRPQSVIDAADVKKALKMTEIDISNGGQGRLAEEEHENESSKMDHGTTGEENAHPAVGVVDSVEGKVEGDVVTRSSLDDSLANVDSQTLLGEPKVRLTLNSSSEEPVIDSETKGDAKVKADGQGHSESDPEPEVKDEPWVKIDKEDIPEVPPEMEVKAKVEVEPEPKVEPEPEPKVEPKVSGEAEVKAGPEMRFKPRLRGEAVVRPESKVASRMNAGFLAELAAGIGGGRKDKRRPQGDEGESKPSETDDNDTSRESKELSPIPQSPGTPKSPSLSLRSASSVSDVSLPPLEELPKLEHLGKSRPRRNKTRAASRAAVKDQALEEMKEVDGGVEEFFERKEVSREYVKTIPEDKEKEKGDEEKKDDSKKKSWSPFNSQPNPKGYRSNKFNYRNDPRLAAGISSFFGRRDKPSPTRSPEPGRRVTVHDDDTPRSPEPARRSLNKSPTPERRRTREKEPEPPAPPTAAPPADDEPKKKEEEEPTPPWRRPPPSIPPSTSTTSSGGGASAILAEMRAKRSSVKPVSPTSTKSDDKENKENKEGNRASIIPPPKENRNSIHPPAAVKERTSVTPAAALRPTSGQTAAGRPVPAPRANSPATQAEKSTEKTEKTEESSDSPPTRARHSFLSKPRPPPIAPKPRSKPSGGTTATSSAKPTIITTPRTSESIGEKPSLPSSASTEKDDKDEVAQPPPRSDRARRRLSVKEKVAFLDKNSNEQPAEQLGRRPSLAKDQASPKASEPPQRAWSMYGGESPRRDDGAMSSAAANGRARHEKASEADDNQDTPNGAAKNDGEFVLFL